jgi:NAD+ kinase
VAVVGLVLHRERSEARALARALTRDLMADGHKVCLPAPDASLAKLEEHAVPEDGFGDGLDLVVSLGGDGCMLRAVHLVAAQDVPVLGVNLGQLGYLTEIEPAGLTDALAQVFAGTHTLEARMLLQVAIRRLGAVPGEAVLALNDVVVSRPATGHTVRIDVDIDGRPFTPYAADGLIVASPTGSTAYNLSARGPIVAPAHRAILLTPVAPHMLFDRSLVLAPTTIVQLTVSGHAPAELAIDGRPLGALAPGESISCVASPHFAQLVTFAPRDFHQILKTKFGLSDR